MVFVGVDLGTTALKCGAWDRAGRRRALVRSPIDDASTKQDAERWVVLLDDALAQLRSELGDERIAAIGVGGHAPSPVLCDASLRAIAPVRSWQDRQADEEFERWCALDPTLREPGDARLEARAAARVGGLIRERPSLERELAAVLLSWEFLIARLTGVCVTTTAAEPRAWRPALRRPPGSIVGTSIDANVPVVVGGVDSWLAAVGSGITQLGDVCINGGSSGIVAQLTAPGPHARFELAGLGLVSEPIRFGDESIDARLEALRRALDSLAQRHGPAGRVVLVGGLAADRRLHAQLCARLGRAIELPTEHEASALGAAMLAAVGIGAFAKLVDAAQSMCSIRAYPDQ